MDFIDRLQRESAPSADAIAQDPWRWLLDLGAGATELSVSGRPLHAVARSVSLLLDIDQPSLHWVAADGRHALPLRIDSAGKSIPLPPAVELRRLGMTGRDSASGEEIIYPLQSPPDEQASYQELIELIEDNAMPLAGICNRPRLNLRIEERAETLRRARRMTLRTAPYLARHAEDWEGQSLHMPYPQRLLTALPEDEWATYENRMVRTVVRDGYAELLRREREIRSTLRQLQQALRVSEHELTKLHRDDWPRTHRIYGLLRGNVSVDVLKKHIDQLDAQAKRLRRAIGILGSARSSQLFRMLGAVRDERELRPTNLLVHDSAYHAALVVRQRLNRFMQAQNDQPVEDPLPRYFRWLESALRQALEQTGFTEVQPDQWTGHSWRVEVTPSTSTWLLKLRFRRMGDGCTPTGEANQPTPSRKTPSSRARKPAPAPPALQRPAASALVIFPLWLDLSRSEERKPILDKLIAAAPELRYLALFPGDSSSSATEHYRHGGLFPDIAISASPGRLDSVEILARELVRETWLRDLLARRWPTWCLVCKNTHLAGDANKFVCDTCHSEAALTQQTCATCGQEYTTPYLELTTAEGDASAVSRSYLLSAQSQRRCAECQAASDKA